MVSELVWQPLMAVMYYAVDVKRVVNASVYNTISKLDFGFPRSKRLLAAQAYKHVFDKPIRVRNQDILLLARPNQLMQGRLGLVVAKKQIRKATSRNKIKRLIRESFRQKQHSFLGIDIVVIAYKSLLNLDNAEINKCLEQHWLKLQTQLKKY